MSSRFIQILMSLTVVSPLLLIMAVVFIALHPSEYVSDWTFLFSKMLIPGLRWWMLNLFLMVFFISFLATKKHLHRKSKSKNTTKSIVLTSLQPKTFNVIPIIAMIAPWSTFLIKGGDSIANIILIITGVIAIVIGIVLSSHGYYSFVFLFLGYNCYEGKNRNGSSITLLSKRHWNNVLDVREIVLLTNEMAIIL